MGAGGTRRDARWTLGDKRKRWNTTRLRAKPLQTDRAQPAQPARRAAKINGQQPAREGKKGEEQRREEGDVGGGLLSDGLGVIAGESDEE